MLQDSTNYQRVEKAIKYLLDNQLDQPSLQDLSDALGISDSHLQRTFTEWAGLSPKQFLQYLNKEYAKSLLKEKTVLESALDGGLSGTGRLHDLLLKTEGVTPGEYRSKGEGLTITFGDALSPWGHCFIASTHRGICKLGFYSSEAERQCLWQELKRDWCQASFVRDDAHTQQQATDIFSSDKTNKSVKLFLRGTPFRMLVWEALLKIPEGALVSYQDLARHIGQPSATRAVANAVGDNPIGFLIPCHRVIRSSGVLSGYRWGTMRKQAIIVWEQGKKQGRKLPICRLPAS